MRISPAISTGQALSRRLKCYRKFLSPRRGMSLALVFTLATMVMSATSCGPNVAQASRDLAKKITLAQATATSPDTTPPNAPPVRVYLDASLSMKGFTSVPGDNTFGAIVEGIGDDLPGCQLYKYGQKGRATTDDTTFIQEARFGRELRQSQFYDLDYNPDDRLLTYLAGEPQPALSVLITDGVYSVPDGKTSPLVVEAVTRWLKRGFAFGILIFKSPFRGTLYAENRPVSVSHVSVEERPFYAFVLSPGMRQLKELRQKLQQRIPAMRAILFSDDAVDVHIDFSERAKGTYSFKRPPTEAYHWHMLNAEPFKTGNRVAVDYKLSYQVAPEYPVSEFRVDVTAIYYRWDRKGFVEVKAGPPGGFDYKLEENKAPTAAGASEQTDVKDTPMLPPGLKVFYPKDAGSNYGFYHLKLLISPRSLRDDIQELSTRDDTDPDNAGRTFRFYELVNAITEIHFNERLATKTSPPLFVTITNH